MTTAVRVNTTTYATTHVATNMLRSIRQIIREAGLDTSRLREQWDALELGLATWLRSQHLDAVVLEVFDPRAKAGVDLVGRFDFTIDYGYYAGADGELWLDPETVSHAVAKAGRRGVDCDYRVVVQNSPGAPHVDGWQPTELRGTAGFTRHSVGTAIGGGSIGASLAYYSRKK